MTAAWCAATSPARAESARDTDTGPGRRRPDPAPVPRGGAGGLLGRRARLAPAVPGSPAARAGARG
ncbi:hypothetical protein ACWDSB_29350, partial [Streptomyces sp. NPDC003514]